MALGFTDEVDALLEACDVVVSKAGGLTCSEALIKGAPLVVYRPTPGQEVRNAEFLEAGGAALHADSIDAVETIVRNWLSDPSARAAVAPPRSGCVTDAALTNARRFRHAPARGPAAEPSCGGGSALALLALISINRGVVDETLPERDPFTGTRAANRRDRNPGDGAWFTPAIARALLLPGPVGLDRSRTWCGILRAFARSGT